MKTPRLATCLILVLAICPSLVMANYVYVGTNNFVGSRETPAGNGIYGTGNWDDQPLNSNNGFKVAWNITYDQATSVYTYNYTFSGTNGGAVTEPPGISHVILEVSEGFSFSGQTGGFGAATEHTSTTGNGNPNLPSTLYGIKRDIGGTTVTSTFLTKHAPVWGDFYAKGGSNENNLATAWNTGFGLSATCVSTNSCGSQWGAAITDYTAWIVVPNLQQRPPNNDPVVPEPGFYGMMGLSFSGLVFAIRRRRSV